MGNKVSSSSGCGYGKVILPDGRVKEIDDEDLTVAELMMEHPHQVVVEFDPRAVNRNRPSPLPADKKLEINKVYLLLPKKRGKPVPLSSEQGRHLLLMANSILSSKPLLTSTTGVLPLFARICTTYAKEGHMIVNNKEKKVVEKKEETTFTELSDVSDERPEYFSRQMSGKGWKPSLDTIKEKIVKKKVSHWIVS